jgi:hypothetical protein
LAFAKQIILFHGSFEMNLSADNFQYAMEATYVLREPYRRIATFGETRFTYKLVSELMDSVGKVRIRSGEVEASKPLLIKPSRDMEFEGFNEESHDKFLQMLDAMRHKGVDLAFLQYGFRFRRSNVTEEIVHEPFDSVCESLLEDVRRSGDPMLAIIAGVDDNWEISLVKFALEMITQSHDINTFDLKRRNML